MNKHGPHGGPHGAGAGGGRPQANFSALGAVVKKFFGYYPVLAPLTMLCILFSSVVSSIPSLFVQNVLSIVEKWYVSRDWIAARAEIMPYISLLAVLYLLSLISMLVYQIGSLFIH